MERREHMGGYPARRLATTMSALGYLTLWMSAYTPAAALCVAHLAGFAITPDVVIASALVTMSTYLLDRLWPVVTGRPGSNRAREAFLRRWRPQVYMLFFFSSAGAIAACWRVAPIASALAPASYAGVLVYARLGDRGRRIKDRLIVKDAAVAVAVTSLVATLLILHSLRSEPGAISALSLARLGAACVYIAGHVFADTVLCDIPDAVADAAQGARTFPIVFGVRATWRAVYAMNVLLALGAVWLGFAGGFDLVHAAMWSVGLLAGAPLIRRVSALRLRDAVDAKLPVVAGVILLAQWLTGLI